MAANSNANPFDRANKPTGPGLGRLGSANPSDDAVKPTGPGVGRQTTTGVNNNPSQAGSGMSAEYSARQGIVVIRATVEQIGLAGDAEMTVTVKWPASAFGQPCAEGASPDGSPLPVAQVPPTGPSGRTWDPGLLYVRAEQAPEPATEQAAPLAANKNAAAKRAVKKTPKKGAAG